MASVYRFFLCPEFLDSMLFILHHTCFPWFFPVMGMKKKRVKLWIVTFESFDVSILIILNSIKKFSVKSIALYKLPTFFPMAYILPPPPNVGFIPNPNLALPIYLLTEVHPVQLDDGQVVMVRRPRPISVVAGARLVLQCDPDRLRR